MARRGDLASQTLQGLLGELVGGLAAHLAAAGFDPDFAWPVDQDVGDVRPGKPRGQRRQIGVKIDTRGHRAGATPEKSRSRTTETCTGAPCGTRMVVGMSICFCRATVANWLA